MSLLAASRALIFDLDGTLLDTEPLYSEAAQRVLNPFGHTYTLALKKKVMGGDSRRSARLTIEEFGLPHTPDQFLREREGHLQALFPDAPEMRGVGDFLEQSRNRGQRLGLATSSHQHLCELKLKKRTWKDIFHIIICGDHLALERGKPAPDIFLLCAEKLGVNPPEVLVFEDSRNGIAAARAAGMRVVAVAGPYTDESDLAGADLVIDDYRELLPGSAG